MAIASDILRIIGAAMATAMVMLAWSELVFFNDGPALNLLASIEQGALPTFKYIIEMTAFYAIPATLLIALVGLFGSHGLGRIMLIGALTGYSIEGAVVPAVYEAVPFSYLWTSIAWHGPITVALGIFVLPRLLATASAIRMLVLFAIMGALWALWTTWIWADGSVEIVSSAEFYVFAAATGALLLSGYALFYVTGWPNVVIPRWLSIALCLPTVVMLVMQGLQVPIFALGLVLIMAGLFSVLRSWGPDREARYKIKPTNAALLIVMPVIAGLVYGILLETGPPIGSEDLVFLVFCAGMIAWILGIAHEVRGRWKASRD